MAVKNVKNKASLLPPTDPESTLHPGGGICGSSASRVVPNLLQGEPHVQAPSSLATLGEGAGGSGRSMAWAEKMKSTDWGS